MTPAPVSVVIPCYRCKGTIARAVASVAAQTRPPAEVILVDDGSGDGTREHLERLAASHRPGWLRVIALARNEGAASARNTGWAAATQPYLAFLDADDAWHPRKIELQHAYMAAHPEVALSGHGCRLARGSIEHERVDSIQAESMSRLALLASNPLTTPSVMLRRGLPQRFRAGRRHVDDHLLWLQIQGAGGEVVWLTPPLAYVYKARYGESGLSGQLWAMEKAELANYWILRRELQIGFATALVFSAWSLGKFARRLGLTLLRSQHGTS